MPGKPGMNKSKRMGGTRSGSGAPYKFAPRKNEHFIFERETIGGEIQKQELWIFNAVEENGDNLIFQCGDDIITIRRPERGELELSGGVQLLLHRTRPTCQLISRGADAGKRRAADD